MKNKCNVARDLMPLVIDGVASDESQQYVDEHIAECTECALNYGAMRVELPRANQEKERAEMEKAAKAMKKMRRKRVFWSIIISAVLSYVLLISANWLWDELTIYCRYPMEKEDVEIQLYRMSDGTGLIVYDLARNDVYVGIGWEYDPDRNLITLKPKEQAIQLGNETQEKLHGGYRTDDLGGWEEAGWMYATMEQVEEWNSSGRMNYMVYDSIPLREIWVEFSDGMELLYRHGDEVPTCSPEMEMYLEYLNNPSYRQLHGNTVEYDYDKLAELRRAVPEWQ